MNVARKTYMTKPTVLDAAELERRESDIEAELYDIVTRRLQGRLQSTAVALRDAFIKLFGMTHSSGDRMQFFLYAAPRIRRLMIDASRAGSGSGTVNLTALDLDQWLARLENFDSECVRMIDLHYFAGLTIRDTAIVLGVSTDTVIRDLRFAKAWLKARVRTYG